MRKFLLSAVLSLAASIAFSQNMSENGIIYITHPYIDVVNKSVQAYRDKDIATNTKLFADTAKFWVSGMEKQVPIADAFKDWATDFDYYTDIKLTQVGYPDYLHYKDQDQKYVQSWWQWKGKSKKTGQIVTIDFVQFDRFNSAGKIDSEALYGDFSKLVKN
jgi:capsule polysaccharide modification protein KpsS